MYLGFIITRDVKMPNRAHPTDAGIDFFCPEITDEFIQDIRKLEANKGLGLLSDKRGLLIKPGTNACIPSGVKIGIPYGYMGLFLNKSGVASKRDLIIGAQVIDTFYSGEVHIDIHNIGVQDQVIESGMKLAQMAVVPVLACSLTEVGDEEMLYDWMKQEEHRNEKGFGSSDDSSESN
jgi:dUTPase